MEHSKWFKLVKERYMDVEWASRVLIIIIGFLAYMLNLYGFIYGPSFLFIHLTNSIFSVTITNLFLAQIYRRHRVI